MQIVFWGATGQAKVLRELIAPQGQLVALFDNSPEVVSPFPDVALHRGRAGFEQWRAAWTGALPFAAVAIGGDRGRDRLELQLYLESHGLAPYTCVHRTAFVASTAHVGAGSQILAQAAVCADARLGRACIVNTAASVDHDCVLGDGVHICPGAHLAGAITVGDHAMVGTGAAVLPRVSIGAGAIIGAGAVVRHDVPAGAVVAGNPARPIR